MCIAFSTYKIFNTLLWGSAMYRDPYAQLDELLSLA